MRVRSWYTTTPLVYIELLLINETLSSTASDPKVDTKGQPHFITNCVSDIWVVRSARVGWLPSVMADTTPLRFVARQRM